MYPRLSDVYTLSVLPYIFSTSSNESPNLIPPTSISKSNTSLEILEYAYSPTSHAPITASATVIVSSVGLYGVRPNTLFPASFSISSAPIR